MSQSVRTGFSYLKHAKVTANQPAVEEEKPFIVEPQRVETSSSLPVIAPGPPEVAESLAPKPSVKPVREKFTTAIAPALRDAMNLQLAKQRIHGVSQSPADLLDSLLRQWLAERDVVVS
jgi:hypothetical protein